MSTFYLLLVVFNSAVIERIPELAGHLKVLLGVCFSKDLKENTITSLSYKVQLAESY